MCLLLVSINAYWRFPDYCYILEFFSPLQLQFNFQRGQPGMPHILALSRTPTPNSDRSHGLNFFLLAGYAWSLSPHRQYQRVCKYTSLQVALPTSVTRWHVFRTNNGVCHTDVSLVCPYVCVQNMKHCAIAL
jgi:hypothetical protein